MEKYFRGGFWNGPEDWVRTVPRASELVGLWHKHNGLRVVKTNVDARRVRGGSWLNVPFLIRFFSQSNNSVSNRVFMELGYRCESVGVRVVRGGKNAVSNRRRKLP